MGGHDMTADQIEDLALAGAPLPDGLNAAEQLLFLQFRYLYRYARLVKMPPEQGRLEKRAILREYEKRAFQVRHMDKTERMWTAIEAAAARFAKEQTVEAGNAFYAAVYGAGVKRKEDKP